jgi:hypothetical protein
MVWNKREILAEIRRQHKKGVGLSYNQLSAKMQSLVSAAAYHFGSYRRAVQQAGIEYSTVLRRPRWTKARIIALIKSAHRRGEQLNWSSVTHRRDELGKAAFASLQPRLFGKWQRALHAAGLDGQEIARYRRWDKTSITHELKSRARNGQPVNSGALQAHDPGLHAAAVRYFGAFDAALRAAGLDPLKFRRRRRWDKKQVLAAIKSTAKSGHSLADSRIRIDQPALYGAAIRLFGAFTTARKLAGIKFKAKKRRKGSRK